MSHIYTVGEISEQELSKLSNTSAQNHDQTDQRRTIYKTTEHQNNKKLKRLSVFCFLSFIFL